MILDTRMLDDAGTTTGEKLFDLSMLYEMDDNEYVAQILTLFLRDTPNELQQIKTALDARNVDVVCRAAHKLKSSVGIVGANGLLMLLDDIEGISKGGNVTNELINKIDDAKVSFDKLQTTLQMVLKELL